MMTTEAPPTASPTERKVAEMLLENTGSHFLDSGGAYGRAWQHARAKYGLNPSKNSAFSGGPLGPDPDPTADQIGDIALIMRDEPYGDITDFGITVDTFHWLVDRLDYDPALDAKYQRWTRVTNFGKDRYDADWGLTLMERFPEQLKATGPYFSNGPFTTNTYNDENALDRTLQFTMFVVSDDGFLPANTYVLLQIHGGADVRGGYTDPVLFAVGGSDDSDMFDYGRMEVWCEGASETPGGTPGQLTVSGIGWNEPAEVEPIYHSHRWDNVYDNGGTLRLSYNDGEDLSWWGPGKKEQVLVLLRESDEATEDVQIEHGYTTPEGRVVRPDVYAIANNAKQDDEGVWRCPFDGSPLHAGGAIVG